ncbi:MAG: tagaturonate reductase, partial [Propionibacteriaceae bacterium]|nr:tagaturonate reductase [Propionibacteriaceae bacterium]
MMQMGRRMVAAPARPTRIIQFGEGNFLRGFLGPQVQQADDAGLFDGGIAIVQPRPGGHVDALERQDRLYTVVTEGLGVREHRIIDVVTATVDPYRAWDDFLALADDPHTGTIVSNTTEAGIAIDPRDTAATVPPRGFPAKLAHLMARRFARGLPGFLVLPCELIDDNAAQLKRCVLSCVADFGLGDDLAGWIESDNLFCSTLVDRIVSGFPAERAEALWVELGYRDDLIVVAEPALSW